MAGFGTVVTGTLLDGRLRTGEAVEAVPGGPEARIRGLQTHQQTLDEALPGTRVAVNLAGVSTDRLSRGQVLARPGELRPATTIDVRVRALAERGLKHNLRLTVHLGAAETQGRLRVLGADEVPAGAEGWCQIQLAPALAASPGDLFVLRVSDQTVGGGRVLEVNAGRRRRSDPAVVERLRRLAEGSPEGETLAALEGVEPATLARLAAAADLDGDALEAAIEALIAAGDAVALEHPAGTPRYISAAGLARLRTRIERALEDYERAHPLRIAMPAGELRARVRLEPDALAALLGALAPQIETRGAGVARVAWSPQPTAAQRRAAEEAIAALDAAGSQPAAARSRPGAAGLPRRCRAGRRLRRQRGLRQRALRRGAGGDRRADRPRGQRDPRRGARRPRHQPADGAGAARTPRSRRRDDAARRRAPAHGAAPVTALLPVLLTVVVGMGGAVQVAMLGALDRQRGPLEAAWISGGGTVLMLALILGARALRGDGPDLPPPLDRPWPFALVAAPLALSVIVSARGVPPYLLLSGLFGGIFITAAAFLAPRIGVALLFSAFTAGTLTGGLILDHIGAFGAGGERATLLRVLGVVVVFAGVVIVRWR